MLRRFKLAPLSYTTPEALADYVLRQMKLLSQAIPGAVDTDLGDSGTAISVTVPIADQSRLQLTDNVTLTLVTTDMKRGQSGDIEFTQDSTGGRTVTFVGLIGTTPAITLTASKRTLVRFTNIGTDGWVATVLASNY